MTLSRILPAVLSTLLLSACGHDESVPHDHDHAPDRPPAHDQSGQSGDARSVDDRSHDHDDGGDHNDHDDHDDTRSVRIAAGIAQAAGLRSEPVGPALIRDEHTVQGLLIPVEGRSARVVARFPGLLRVVHVGTGDQVRAGQALATVESNLSLSRYTVTAPIAGTVLVRNAAVGDLAGETPLFEIVDLDVLWVDLHLFGADADHITAGLPVVVERLSDGHRADTVLDRILPGAATASQSAVARARLDNADGRWRPGAAVLARVTVAERQVPASVALGALQRMDGDDVVFVREDETYTARPVTLGERDSQRVEIVAGLDVGEQVVVEQSYLVKADIGKAGASHDH